jgi:hypothetical protein
MLVAADGTLITDTLTNASGVYYLNISDANITDNSCTSSNVCDLKVQPASLAIGDAVDKDTLFQGGTFVTGQDGVDLLSKTLDVADE